MSKTDTDPALIVCLLVRDRLTVSYFILLLGLEILRLFDLNVYGHQLFYKNKKWMYIRMKLTEIS